MARQTNSKDISLVLTSARNWIETCLIGDGSLFSSEQLWTAGLVEEVRSAFVDHPDNGDDDFRTKLKGQMESASPAAQRLMSEILWGLLLFPSNVKARTKRNQIREIWLRSGMALAEDARFLGDGELMGIGSGGPAFNNYRPEELKFLIALIGNIKTKSTKERRDIFENYDLFVQWIGEVPQKGDRQFRHMLRYFAFPDRVERISSNNDRRKILNAFGVNVLRVTKGWSDSQLDDALLALREKLVRELPDRLLDFYEPPLRERWSDDHKVQTATGAATIIVPDDEDDNEAIGSEAAESGVPESRRSIQIQAKLAEIGAIMGLKIWIPAGDRARVSELVAETTRQAFLENLPLNYNKHTLDTISQIDVLWLRRQSIVRAFEVEHTTAVYSGLLRMADLLALQPNMKIQLHIVAPEERREKVFREMLRPVFTYLEAGPLSQTCSFISYDGIEEIRSLGTLYYTNESVIESFEERAEEVDL